MKVTGYITHTAKANETFDMLALKYYSDEFMASYIIEANVNHSGVIEFEGGEKVKIPVFDTLENDETLAPWRRE